MYRTTTFNNQERRMPIELRDLPRQGSQPASLTREEYARLLNVLHESERAGAKLLAAYGDEVPLDSDQWAWLRFIQRDEARNCSVLIHLLLEEGLEPSSAVGDFHRKGLGIRGWNERLRFLNRGQQWWPIASPRPCRDSSISRARGRYRPCTTRIL
jgi:Domain of unknown function (DUF6306)